VGRAGRLSVAVYLIVIGADPVGESLVRLALEADFDTVLIEEDADSANAMVDKYDVRVLNAAIADENIMQEADAARADAVIAATHDDSTNLMAVILAQQSGVDNVISVVNHQHHQRLFERLGVRVLVHPEVLVARHLLDMALHPHMSDVTSLGDHGQVMQMTLQSGSPLVGTPLAELGPAGRLPQDSRVVSVARDGEHFFAAGDTELRAGDEIILYARRPLSEKNLSTLIGDSQ